MSFFSNLFAKASSNSDSNTEESSSSSESESVFSEVSEIQEAYQDIKLIQLIDNVEQVFEQKLLEREDKVTKKKLIQSESVIYETIDRLVFDSNHDKFKMLLYKNIIEMVIHLIDLEIENFKKELNLANTFEAHNNSSLIHCHFLENVIVAVHLTSKSKLYLKQDSNLIEVNDNNLNLIQKVYKKNIKRGEKVLKDLRQLLIHINEKVQIIDQNVANFVHIETKLLCELYRKRKKRKKWITRLIK